MEPTIHVDPPEAAPADAAVSIRLLGCPPGEALTLHASRDDDFGRTWKAQAAFTAGSDGRVDVRTAPSRKSFPYQPNHGGWQMAVHAWPPSVFAVFEESVMAK
jgi:hypothetical protein